ncbi:MAG: class I SAM-dependent methyltransferase [Betaproteobacteria bacterium]|nr:class I SAM-dependent methyltransferase [Betaproteobacteria bacterium]
MHKLVLKPGREKSLKRRHPWVFSGAVAKVTGKPESGETIEIHASTGEFLAVAAYSPQSQIVARVWDWVKREIDADFFRGRIERALALRAHLLPTSDAARLVHAESDGLPGMVADRYGGIVVLQLSSAGAVRWRDALADALETVVRPKTIFERSDADVLALEGIEPRIGMLRGTAPPAQVTVDEAGATFEVDVPHGHKTGFYLDQRGNRLRLRELAAKREVLDCFAYTGGFTVNALIGGAATVTAIDSSGPALGLLARNVALNQLPQAECIEGDVFQVLRKMRDQARSFDLIVLDPPKFAPTAAHADRAARAYKDINLLAFKLLRPGGLLFTFSCSGGVSRDLFQKIVAGSALDAGVDAQIVEQLSAGADHPVALNFPEGEYLKGLVCRVAADSR